MGEKMTLEQVRDRCISWLGDVACNGAVSGIAAKDIRAIFEPHLATPAQTVDVDSIEYVIGVLRLDAKSFICANVDNSHFVRMADKLSQAIGDKP